MKSAKNSYKVRWSPTSIWSGKSAGSGRSDISMNGYFRCGDLESKQYVRLIFASGPWRPIPFIFQIWSPRRSD